MTADDIIPLSQSTFCFPIRHGKAVFTLELRRLLWNTRFDCLCLAFPEILEADFSTAVLKLPFVHAICLRNETGTLAYVPMDPCDAYVEAVRQALQRNLPFAFLEDDTLFRARTLYALPDAYLVKKIGLVKYYEMLEPTLRGPAGEPAVLHRAARVLQRLVVLEKRHRRILLLCDFALLAAMLELRGNNNLKKFKLKNAEDLAEPLQTAIYPIKPDHLYFTLGELPFYAAELEKERYDPLTGPADYLDLVKKLFAETRRHHLSGEAENTASSLTRMQIAMNYLRNLSALNGRLVPDLFDLVTTAKGVFGPYFALKALEAAKYYPFFDLVEESGMMTAGVGVVQTPEDVKPVRAVNLFEEEIKTWKTIHLKKEPDKTSRKKYRYLWDPQGMCSYIPEDVRIENFNRTVRRRSHQLLTDGLSRSEKFTASLKDGLDIRETLRNWHKGDIFIREIPPDIRPVDTVIIIFDDSRDHRYPHRATWFAEHVEESTLTFFATDPFEHLIGPGVAKAQYGGLSLLFPPRQIVNVFELDTGRFHDLTEQLVYGALLNSREPRVSFVAERPPGLRLKRMAGRFGKKLIWLPLGGFSRETLRKLKVFHVLNGKHVRSWASRFILE